MNDEDFKLNEAFRALALSEPRSAPPSVEAALLQEFRRRRPARRWRIAALIPAAAALVAGWFAFRILAILDPQPPTVELARITPPPVIQTVAKNTSVISRRHPRRPVRAAQVASVFYTLPGASMLPPLDFGTVVRVELPLSALAFVGLPVNENRALERVRADVLLGQDGQARAVRLIQ